MSKELELETVTREKERTKWVAVLVQMNNVQKYGVMRFLAEKMVENLDDNVLYVSKKNVQWRNSIIKQGQEESTKFLKELNELINMMWKYLKCIDMQLMKGGTSIIEEAANMTEFFQEMI